MVAGKLFDVEPVRKLVSACMNRSLLSKLSGNHVYEACVFTWLSCVSIDSEQVNTRRCIIHVKLGQQHHLCRMTIITFLALAVFTLSVQILPSTRSEACSIEQHTSVGR